MMKRIAGAFALFGLLLLPLSAGAQEKILLFSSTATLTADSSLEVQEDILVNIEGRQIRRGIYRDFPTTYRDASGKAIRVGFSVKNALLNGKKIPYKTESRSNGVRVYLGDPNSTAPLGKQTYTIVYTTTGQIGFFENHDELYWNVTGNDWDFLVEEARFSLAIPGRAPFNSVEFYTGRQGAQGRAARILPDDSVETTAPLGPREGLTVVYTWPKGIVSAPTPSLLAAFFQRYAIYFLIAVPLCLFLVYFLLWLRWGRSEEHTSELQSRLG